MPHSRSLLLLDDSDAHKCNGPPRPPLLVLRNASLSTSFALSIRNARATHASDDAADASVILGPGDLFAVATLELMEFDGGAHFTAVYVQRLDSAGNVDEIPFAAVADPTCSEPNLELLYCGLEPRSDVSMLYESTADLRGLSPFRRVVNYAITPCLMPKCARGHHISERFLQWKAGGERWSDVNTDALSSVSPKSSVSSEASPIFSDEALDEALEETLQETAPVDGAV